MARKRLGGPLPDYLDGGGTPSAPGPALPIAQVAGDAAAMAALAAVSEELARARAEGRMVLALPLEAIVTDYLIRDRVAQDSEEMAALKASLVARGQQTPIEVAEIASDKEVGRYGLISGARRMMALKELFTERGEPRFGTVLALVRQPEGSTDPYIAMVEENEIRAGLSYYERARIVMRAVEAGVFADETTALRALFANVSYTRRSKIKSFISVVAAFDKVLQYPTHIPERVGLALAQALATKPGFGPRAAAILGHATPSTPEEEARTIAMLLRPSPSAHAPQSADLTAMPGLQIRSKPGRVEILGEGVTVDFVQQLQRWVQEQIVSPDLSHAKGPDG